MSTTHRPRRTLDASSALPKPPKWFNKGQKEIYKDLGAKVVNLRIWADSDFDAFCILVDNLYGYQEASAIIAKEGVLSKGRDGGLVRHPATIARNACWANVQPLLVAFGLTPSARASMGLTGHDEADPVTEYLMNALLGEERETLQ